MDLADMLADAVKQAREKNERLAAWKREQRTVLAWWKELDDFVRTHPEAVLGMHISKTALAWLTERDSLRAMERRLRTALDQIESSDPETNRQHADEIANSALAATAADAGKGAT
jgi:hypothetical protein